MANNLYDGLWSLVEDTLQALAKHYMPAFIGKANDLQLTERGGRSLLGLSTNFQLNGLTLADILQREAYYPQSRMQGMFDRLVEHGWIDEDNGSYSFTDMAKEAIDQINTAGYDYLTTLDVMSDDDVKLLLDLLKRILDRAQTLPYAYSLKLQPMKRAQPNQLLGQVNDYLNGLNALRDDSHLATWRDTGLSGHAWEMLTFYWRNEDYSKFLQYRGFSEDEHQIALNTLVERGWFELKGDEYAITVSGRQLRDEAETQTDTNFYAAWDVLSDNEVIAVRRLLKTLKDSLEADAEEKS